MAVDKLVDSTQLDTDLTAVANAIRTKGGTSAQLAFPAGFVSAVEAIPTGGSDYAQMVVDGSQYAGKVVSDYSFTAAIEQFRNVKWTEAVLLNMETVGWISGAKMVFYGATSLTDAVLPKIQYLGQECFRGCTAFKTLDVGSYLNQALNISGANLFYGCTNFDTFILRHNTVVPIGNTLAPTKFGSGNTGGTVYIPKVLYDHLGDGTSLDYKSATNWSVYDGYGTITWAQIEGSIYETQYADGTPIT